MYNCPRVTAGALQRLLSALTGLEDVTLGGSLSGAITDASLAALHGRSQLRIMRLGTRSVLCTDIPVTAVSRLVVTCRRLEWLIFHATEELSQTVLDALVRGDLGKRDDGTTRTLWFQVSGAVYDKLNIPSDTGNIKVLREDESCGSSLKFIFPPGHSEEQLTALLESLQSLEELTVSVPPDSTGRWLRLLPPSLRRLDVYDCPRVTAGALQRLLSALTGLEDVTLGGTLSCAITDASLAAVHGCSQLRKMQLGDRVDQCTDIPVTAVSRLVVTCRKLEALLLIATEELSQRVLDALVRADLGKRDDGTPRTLWFQVSEAVYDKLIIPSDTGNIKVLRLRDDKSCGSSLKLIFPPGHSDEQLTALLESLRTLEELTVSIPPDSTGRWLRLLPPSLRSLDVYGPGETGKPANVPKERRPDHGLTVVIKRAGDDVIDQLAKGLGPRVTALTMYNCPRVTAGALQRLLSALTGLEDVTLGRSLSGAITDASLAALHGCSQLRIMQLGDTVDICTNIPVTAVSRLVVTCRKLEALLFNATEELSQRVLDALVEADLGKRDNGTPRTLGFVVLGAVYDKLNIPSDTGNIKVLRDDKSCGSSLKLIFPPGHSEERLTALLESLRTLEELTVSIPPDSTGRWLRLIPPSLRRLDVYACPRVTAGALQRLLSALTVLEDVTLGGSLSGAITDASLAALHGCSQLRKMQLGDRVDQCTDIPVTAVSRLVVTCRKLEALLFIATEELSQRVLDALVRADLGKRDDGTPRTLRFKVPEAVYDKLIIPSDTGNIKVLRLRDDKSCGSSLKLIFPPGHSDEQLTALLESLRTLEELTVSIPPDSTGRWLRLLPPSLRRLDVYGPGETGKPLTLARQPDHGLEVVIQQAGDDVINQLSKELGPRVTGLNMFNCPRVTAGALQRLLSALTGLEDVTLDGSLSGAITDASLAALHGCSQLRKMQLGQPYVLCTDIPVTAVNRLAVTCRKLEWLNFNAKEELSQRVLDALVRADLGKRDDGTPRTLSFKVLGAVYDKLNIPSHTGSIEVVRGPNTRWDYHL
ncbi:uncharacterized protein LOC122383169 [Amphibalanus amphitrite]|uniref:uncharacterized protein LOC122383169 n=1 Tax=Amphibalanus amphitrite TaxID=1232801 RepID=UPI001C904BAD|nr:uncharacterized protein LOC122383169 [Amphibalanus amphitrite]